MKPNAIVAQSGGPTTVINSSVCGVIQSCIKSEAINKVYGANNGILGVLKEELFDITAESADTIELLKSTPAAAIGSCRYKLKSGEGANADYERILDVFKSHDIHYFFYAGGNDSMDTADKINKLAAQTGYDLVCMGVPKTIDNDLACTDHCPGYGSVAKYVAVSAMNAGKDTEALYTTDTCTILEVMGRNAGWIAAAAGLAKREAQDAPHLIYLPETAFSIEKFVNDCKEVYREFGRIFIVAGEGLRNADGTYLTEDSGSFGKDSFGHAQLGGVAEILKDIVEREVGVKARFNKLGTNQRCAMHFASLTDVNEAYLCGKMAVEHALNGENGKMVTLVRESNDPYECKTGLALLSDVANGEKFMPAEYINENQNGVTQAFKDYLRPLVQGQAPIRMGDDGLPVYMRFDRKMVAKKLPDYF